MSHTHDTSPPQPAPRSVVTGVAVAIGVVAIAAAIGCFVLWPHGHDVARAPNPYGGKGVTLTSATVTAVKPFDCGGGGDGPDGTTTLQGPCAHVTAATKAGTARFDLDSGRFHAGMSPGDSVRLARIQPDGQPASWEFVDFQRGTPLMLLAAAFALVVIVVARLRGLFALVGIALTFGMLVKFVLPAILAGEPPLAVAITGSTAIMLVVLYLAHGVSVRTSAAVFGTLGGIAMTAALGWAATSWTHLNGIGTEDDQALFATVPGLHLPGVLAATMVIAGLGVLNDVTVTQASAVWELRSHLPDASRTTVFGSAMRIGRDHIASSVYTLVFAYAGTAMTILLLIVAYQRGLADIATAEQIAEELTRTLVGAIGLVLAVPLTTLIAVGLAPDPSRHQHIAQETS